MNRPYFDEIELNKFLDCEITKTEKELNKTNPSEHQGLYNFLQGKLSVLWKLKERIK